MLALRLSAWQIKATKSIHDLAKDRPTTKRVPRAIQIGPNSGDLDSQSRRERSKTADQVVSANNMIHMIRTPTTHKNLTCPRPTNLIGARYTRSYAIGFSTFGPERSDWLSIVRNSPPRADRVLDEQPLRISGSSNR